MAELNRPEFPVPRHVAVIMDGNGRWARRGGAIRVKGHEAGVAAVRDVTTAAAEWGIEHLTLYAFSLENWQRPRLEVEALMRLLKRYLREELPTLLENGIALRAMGRLQDLPKAVQKQIREVEAATAHGSSMILRLCLSYGGRQELETAVRTLAEDVRNGVLQPDQVDEDAIRARLHDAEMPDPDLIIRTAGEQRLSNFLLWQSSYAELWFTDTLWPEFRREHLLAALRDYHGRVRRFGKVLTNDPAVNPAR